MVNVGCRDADGLEKGGHKIKTVFGDIKKLLVFGDLVCDALALDVLRDNRNKHFVARASAVPAQQRLLLQPRER